MQEALQAFAAGGPPRDLAGNSPLPLDDRDSVWLVSAGWVDVFALSPPRDGVAGARRHLFRAEAGQALFGVGAGSLLAVGGPGSQVLRLGRPDFEDLARRAELAAPLAALLAGWVRSLTGGVARDRLPKKVTLLDPEKEVELAEGGIATPARGTLWVRHVHGSSRFVGHAGPSLSAGDRLFPLAAPGWLAAAEAGTRLTALTTEAALSDPEVWPGLDHFHQAALACVDAQHARADATDRGRLERRSEAERRLLRSTLARLAEVADGGDEVGLDGGLEDDPLLSACRLVGARLGVAIERPLGGGETKRRSDPVTAIARASRIRVRRVLLSGDWFCQDNGPLLGYWARSGGSAEDDRPVALLPVSTSRYEVIDPVDGKAVPLTAANAGSVQPFAYTFYRPFESRSLTPWRLFRFGVAGGGRDWLRVALLGLAGSLLGMFTPIVTGWVFDHVIPGAEHDELLLVVLALAVSALVAALFQLTRGIAMLRLESKMEGTVQAGIWDRLLNLPAPFFRRFTAGDLADRAMGIAAMRQVLTDVALSSVLGLVFTLAYFGLLFYYDVRLALLACGLFVVVLLGTALAAARGLRYQRSVYQLRGKIAGLVLQLITGITRLRVAAAEDRALAVWGREFGAQRRLSFRARCVGNNLATFNAAVPIVSTLALFGTVALLPREGLSLGHFLAFNVAFVQILAAAVVMGSAITTAIQVVPLYERARPILDAAPEVDVGKAVPGDLAGDIEISHVSFRYRPDGLPILDDVSIHVRPGEFVAFVGPSGAGKSTLIRLLLGFEAPTAGSVYYDREDLAGLDRQAVRRQIGVVLQDGKILMGDIFSNIIGSSLLTLEDAWEAAYLAGLDDDIADMPMGMHTVVSDGGGTLSGGQRQRLLIARAVVGKPRILLFDEATSALDNETQAKVSRSLERLKATRIVVAHRLSTIRNADRIYVLDAGRVVQQGKYQQLLDQGGLFAELAKRQLA
ncbi:MAG TPA: NHLP bacteriocin export ABC transporter permease/ATPase subunit [Gemmataceae bacterium]|nr:NHLP bacteriocin export ABC transporter permease/ATPase subunit [Gemmataceae bacterium]